MIKRILIVGGIAESLLRFRGHLIEQLRDSGIEVHVAASSDVESAETYSKLKAIGADFHGVSLTRTGMNPLADMETLRQFYVLMRRIRPDAILSYTAKAVIYGSIAARLAGVPKRYALITGLGYAFQAEEAGKGTKFIAKKLYAAALSKADKVFFQNPDDREVFQDSRVLRSKAPTCIVNGSGVDVEYYALTSLPSEPIRFLMTSRLLGDKGVREYVLAARMVKAKYPNSSFGLVGWIDSRSDAIQQSELDEWISSGTIDFLGRLDDVRPAIARSHVFVLPSYYEGTPRSVLEAMAMGRPVITTDAPGCRETVVDGHNGFLVTLKSAEAIAAAMMQFIHQPELISKMGLKSRELAESKYDVRIVNRMMLDEMGIKCSSKKC
jgi:glycosyltransferase involved in cell wall biosynthesis